MDCNKTKTSIYEFYTAIQKVGESIIKIYKNPTYIYLEKYSDFRVAFWIKDIKDISSCFHFYTPQKKILEAILPRFRIHCNIFFLRSTHKDIFLEATRQRSIFT